MRLVAEGLPNKLIAKRMNLSLYTIKNHIHNALEKTGSASRDMAALRIFHLPAVENPCGSCPAKTMERMIAKLKLVAADLRRIADELEGA
jgi:hypothetical protein